MLLRMEEMDAAPLPRLPRLLLAAAGLVLLATWVASMSVADGRLCSAVPLYCGLALSLLLAVAAMVAGLRPARPTLLCLLGILAGLYFLLRCLAGDALSEIWREMPHLLGAFVCYGAGYVLAQRGGGRALILALLVGVLANIAYLFLLHGTDLPQEITGRPAMTMAGANSRGCALLIYKNFAAIFFMVGGTVLFCRLFWAEKRGWGSYATAIVGAAGIACSFLCHSRSVYVLVPLLSVAGWLLWLIIRLYGNRRIGWGTVLTGIALFVGIASAVGDIFMGDSFVRRMLEVDTHLRTHIWGYICNILPDVPWCGYGAGEAQWRIVPFFHEWQTPNYAHNEYLQAWVEYGIVGLVLMVSILGSHLAAGFWKLASEDLPQERRALIAACMLLLFAFAGCAVFEFVWHSMALAGLTAFACGMLASPVPNRGESLFVRKNWAAGSRPPLRPVRFAGRGLTACSCVAALTLASGCLGFAWRLLPAWQAQWQYNALCRAGASEGERVEFLERAVESYPDPRLADHYVRLRPPAGRADDLARMERVLRLALAANPRELFTVVMLVDVLGRQGKCAEAEALMRDTYAPGGQDGTCLTNWPGYYAQNLLIWGRAKMREGDFGSALSMMDYAFAMQSHGVWFAPNTLWRGGEKTWEEGYKRKDIRDFAEACRIEAATMRAVGVEKDDSWQLPLRPGGAPALYERWGNHPKDKKH